MDRRDELTETNWSYCSAHPSTTVGARGCELGGFSERASTAVHRLELPTSSGVIVLCCGEPIALQPALSPGPETRLSAFFGGLQVGAQLASHAGSNDCIEIRLPPSAAYALFGGVVTESSRDPVDLLEVDANGIGVLLDQLRTARTWQRRFAAVDGFLAQKFAKSQHCIPAELTEAWGTIDRSHGQIAIAALARSVGLSERHFTNRFRTYFGVRPKAAARRLRLAHAFNLVAGRPQNDLSTIAAQTGFSDQSHMTREFQVFAGVTPGVLRTAHFDDLPGIPATVLSSR
jgi:AraC-like DNA-binding protein